MSRLTLPPGGGGGTASPLTTKGDLYGYGVTNVRVPVGADGQVLVADSTQGPGTGYVTLPVAQYQWKSGTWHNSADAVRATATVSSAQVVNSLAWAPVIIPAQTLLSGFGFEITAAAATGGKGRLGLFSYDGNLTMTLLLDGGEVGTDTVGQKIATVSHSVAAGCYWVGLFLSAPCSIRATSGVLNAQAVGYAQATDITGAISAFYVNGQGYGPFAASYAGLTAFTGNAAIYGVRKA